MKKFYLELKDRLTAIPSDKYLHFVVCMILTQLMIEPCSLISMKYAYLISGIIVLLIGIAKELFDKFVMKTVFDMNDLLADFLGIVTGLLMTMIVLNVGINL